MNFFLNRFHEEKYKKKIKNKNARKNKQKLKLIFVHNKQKSKLKFVHFNAHVQGCELNFWFIHGFCIRWYERDNFNSKNIGR